jgi:hypothetical protein
MLRRSFQLTIGKRLVCEHAEDDGHLGRVREDEIRRRRLTREVVRQSLAAVELTSTSSFLLPYSVLSLMESSFSSPSSSSSPDDDDEDDRLLERTTARTTLAKSSSAASLPTSPSLSLDCKRASFVPTSPFLLQDTIYLISTPPLMIQLVV